MEAERENKVLGSHLQHLGDLGLQGRLVANVAIKYRSIITGVLVDGQLSLVSKASLRGKGVKEAMPLQTLR